MELSTFTMNLLKNYSGINPNLVIREGNSIMTMSEAKNVLAQASVPETFDRTVGIYDLSEFLSVLNLFDTSNIKLEEKFMTVSDTSGRSKIKYFMSDTDILTSPTKPISMPDGDVKFYLDQETLGRVKKASSALGHDQLSITPGDGVITLSVVNIDNATSNTYSIDVPGESSGDYNFILNIKNLQMIPGNYNVAISSKLISQFTLDEENTDLKYWVALEKTSTYK
ncbi:hypothetical protein OAL25_00255 [bacterium]|nr:hypothetical protein [bacterium]